MATQWMVAWMVLSTGQTGHGMCIEDKAIIEGWVEYGNTEFAGEIVHWIEPCGEDV